MAAAADHLKRFGVFGWRLRRSLAPDARAGRHQPYVVAAHSRAVIVGTLGSQDLPSLPIEPNVSRPFRDLLCDREARRQAGGLDAEQIDKPADPVLILGLN
jgi:hypothetical protein